MSRTNKGKQLHATKTQSELASPVRSFASSRFSRASSSHLDRNGKQSGNGGGGFKPSGKFGWLQSKWLQTRWLQTRWLQTKWMTKNTKLEIWTKWMTKWETWTKWTQWENLGCVPNRQVGILSDLRKTDDRREIGSSKIALRALNLNPQNSPLNDVLQANHPRDPLKMLTRKDPDWCGENGGVSSQKSGRQDSRREQSRNPA